MSRREVIEFKCDVCGKVFQIENNPLKKVDSPLKTVQMPARRYDCEGRNHTRGISDVEMCKDCFEKYWEYSQSRYSVADCYGITVVVKGGE